MQLDTITQMDEGAADPVGTKAEVRALKLPLVKYATCSLPGKFNRGCRHFDDPQFGPCPVLELLRRRGRPGPENVAVVTIKSPTKKKQDAMPCYTYMQYLGRMSTKIALSEIIGIGGDKTIRRRTTTAVDPTNPRSKTKLTFEPEPVRRFPRPIESMAERVESINMAAEIRAARADRMADLGDGLSEQELEDRGDDLEDDDAKGPGGESRTGDEGLKEPDDDEDLDLDDDDDPDNTP